MSLREKIRSSGRTVVVLCGGDSSEREVSLVSGRSVAEAVEANGLACELIDLERNAIPAHLHPDAHLVLPIIHGKYGEDGCLSAELDQRGFAYAGCQQAASVLCYDKYASKAIAARLGIPVASDCLLVPQHPMEHDTLSGMLGEPYILKPRWDGSSVGLHLVKNRSDYEAAGDDLAGEAYLAESYIEGTDVTVGILGEQVLGVVAIRPKGGLYDYAHKYQSGMSVYEAPARIDEAVAADLRQWSKQVFSAAGCRDMARVDFRLAHDGHASFLEINTIPGMTPTSLLPKSAGCYDISFNQLVLQLVGFAFERSGELAG